MPGKDELKKIFETEINNSEINIATVRAKTETDDRLSNFEWNDKSQKALLDSIRYVISSNAKGSNCAVPTDGDEKMSSETVAEKDDVAERSAEQEEERANRVVKKKRTRANYNRDEINKIWRCIGEELIKTDSPLVKSEATRIILSKPGMKPLVDKFGVKSLMIKIRTERDRR